MFVAVCMVTSSWQFYHIPGPRLDFAPEVPETRRVPFPKHITAACIAAAVTAAGCRDAPPGGVPASEIASATDGALVVARGVALDIPGDGGGIAVLADDLALDRDGNAVLRGDVRVAFGGGRFATSGRRLDVSDGGRRIAMSGGVRAVIEIGCDGGVAR
jgi:hypothetical protein